MKAMALASIAAFVSLNGAVAGERAAERMGNQVVDRRPHPQMQRRRLSLRRGRILSPQWTIAWAIYDLGRVHLRQVLRRNRTIRDRVVVNDNGYTMISGSGQRLSFLRPDLADQNSSLTGLTPGLRGPTSIISRGLARPTLNNDPLENPPLSGPSLTGSPPGTAGGREGRRRRRAEARSRRAARGLAERRLADRARRGAGGGQAIGAQPPSGRFVAPGAAALGFGGGRQQVPGAGLVPGLRPGVTPQAGYGAGATGVGSTNSSLTSGLPSGAELPGEGAPDAGLTDQATGQPWTPTRLGS